MIKSILHTSLHSTVRICAQVNITQGKGGQPCCFLAFEKATLFSFPISMETQRRRLSEQLIYPALSRLRGMESTCGMGCCHSFPHATEAGYDERKRERGGVSISPLNYIRFT